SGASSSALSEIGGARGAPSTSDGSPPVGDVALAGRPNPTRATASPSGGSTSVAEIPDLRPASAVAQADIDQRAASVEAAPLGGGSEALPVEITAPDGPGGLGTDYAPEVGISARQARSDS